MTLLDKHSPAVRQFVRELEDEIESKRTALERKGKDPTETEFIRGEIKAFRTVLNKIYGDPDDNDPTK